MNWRQKSALVLACGMLGACSAGFLAEGGPSQGAAVQNASLTVGSHEDQSKLPFVLISPTVEMATSLPGEPDRFGTIKARGKSEIRAKVGDLILVTIFESGSGGLFTTPQAAGNSGGGGNFINLPAQAVDNQGNISVPYAGTVSVAGRDLKGVQREIETKLKDRAIEPQAIVTIQDERASVVSVIGAVKEGGQFPVRNTQMRVLDAVARAGGPDGNTRGLEVVLQRSGQISRVSLRRLVLDPTSNVPVLPGDTVVVQPISRAINIFGAASENTRIEIDVDNMTLTDALGRAKGFNDNRADVASIFVLRMEDRRSVPANTENLAEFTGQRVPTVYQIRYDSPGGIFVGNHFRMRHGDVVYISNATGTQLRKLLELIGLVTRPVRETSGMSF